MSQDLFPLLEAGPARRHRLARGAVLFRQGDRVARVFRVDDGAVHLIRRDRDGNAIILQRAGPGAILAEASVLSAVYHCDAEAVEPARLTSWDRRALRQALETRPEAALALAAHLANEVRTARLRAEILSLRRVCDRLDAWLAWHAGTPPERGEWHHVAHEIGVSPEALYRELARRRRA